ncbi:efflux RND transporter periplasmic adaptor subunit [Paenibacillus hemerocallicola]|uniref:Efflux RND transporter periplasmic adaptor subunit n=1 Tax=Paenibacillus hemerocallicola TaxID=1172614 RepID=A0A5C4T1F6_9BACL|nr:efflux RND transporter periplasmic adaptor subunit [Paenibacillus hemerocallicola]TNJ62932.1 efflux RND transporter periplasmic adaptor subunit [Paenibacillus hemerocallicola]
METVDSMPQSTGSSRRKRTVGNVIAAFALLMVTLTLFSNTLLNFSLPQVTVEKPAPGFLSHEVTGTGTVENAEVAELNLDTRLTVDQVFVKVGDYVTAGQTLVTFRTEETRDSLLDEEARYEQKKLSIGKLQDNLIEAKKAGNELQSRSIERDLTSAGLELQIQERKIRQLRAKLAEGAKLVSTVDGKVVELNATEGLVPQTGRAIARVTDQSKGYSFKTTIDATKAKYVNVGDEVDVIVASLGNARVKGRLSEVNDPVSGTGGQSTGSGSASERKELVVELSDTRLKGGESGELFAAKRMPQSRQLVSNAAVREDDSGKYVLLLKEKKGPLGNEFYAQRAAVTIGDSDDGKASIESGVTMHDQLIVSSSKPIGEGDRVMMAQ